MPTVQPSPRTYTSEENPALPLQLMSPMAVGQPEPTSTALVPPVVMTPHRATQVTRTAGGDACGACCVLILAILAHGVYAGFLYGYIKADSEPLPRTVINGTPANLATFHAFMYIFGLLVASIDAGVVCVCLLATFSCLPASLQCLAAIFNLAMIGATFMSIIALPWIFGPRASQTAYEHACDSEWIQITLTGHTAAGIVERNIASFSLVSTGELLWTWTSNDPFENDFNLVGLNSTSPTLLPALGNVTIDHATNELTRAWCYNDTKQCATGYVWPFDGLFIEVQFNGTLTRMKNRYRDWSFMNVPGVIMHRVDDNGRQRERVMQTYSSGCREMKICVSSAMQRQTSIVDPDVLVAAYWLLHKQAAYSAWCTR